MKPMTARGLRRISNEKLHAMARLLTHSDGTLRYRVVTSRAEGANFKPVLDCPCPRCLAHRVGIVNVALPESPMDVVSELTRRMGILTISSKSGPKGYTPTRNMLIETRDEINKLLARRESAKVGRVGGIRGSTAASARKTSGRGWK